MEIVFYRYLLNPIMRTLLRSPLHWITSKNIAILHFSGRKSGRRLSTPLSYTQEGSKVRLLSSCDTHWWRNLRGGETPVDIEIARQRLPGTALLFEGDSEPLREGVRRFITALPRDAKVYSLQLDEERKLLESSLASIAPRLVLVEISLDSL
jgi:hypothetical protein